MTRKDLPVRKSAGVPDAASGDSATPPAPDAKISILLVDDEPKNLTVLETILHDPSYRLVLAKSADEALLALVSEEFALLVLDIRMPDMNGFELAQMIKQRKKTAGVPIIFLTAYYNEDQHVLEGYETGAVDYLHKPVNPTILRSKVAIFADLYRKSREVALANRALTGEVSERRRVQEELVRLNDELERRVEERTSALLRANAAVRDSTQRLELALKGADLGVWDWNLATGVAQYDARCAEMLGLTKEQVAARPRFWEERVHPDDLPGLRAALDAHLAGRASDYRVQHRLRHADGRWIWILSSGRVVERDEAGHPLRACGIHLDITARKQAEDALKRSEAFARSMVESSADCIHVCSPDGRIQWTNEIGKRLIEQPDSDRLRLDDWVSSWEDGEGRAEAESALAAARSGGVGRFRGAYPTVAGAPRWWDVVVTPIPGPDGAPEQLLCVSRDVTEQREAEEELKEADRRKDEFLAMLAHELRNPLAPIRNAVEILRLLPVQDADLAAARDVIDRQVTHMIRLVDDLLDVSRVSRGKIKLEKFPLELVAAVQQAVEMSRPLIDARRHQLTVTVPNEAVRVEGDFTRLAQVVLNLLNNAAKYTDAGGKIGLKVEKVADRVVLRVHDTGRGIDPSALKNVFDLFYQADRNLDRSEGGLGIGLSLVKSIVHLHGGTVGAHSGGRGKGSEFVVSLPSLPAAAAEPRAEPFAAAAPLGRAFRILVVDDNRDAAESLALMLRMDGHRVLVEHDGEPAVETSLRERPDVVFLDIGLPGMNGYQACQAMRDQGLTDTLIVAMTGYGQENDRRKSREAGFDAHEIKPVDPRVIRELLARQPTRCRVTG